MTNEQAKSEIMQIYMSLSEEKKQALDVLMAQNCDQCEVGNPCLYCEHEFKAQADGEYISKDAVKEAVHTLYQGLKLTRTEDDVQRCINELPTVAIPNKTGHWIEEDMFDGDVAYRCSECDELFWLEDGTPKDNGYDFCPKCGARMD